MRRSRYAAESEVLDELVCFDLYAASRALTRRYRPMLEDLDLTYPQYLVVIVLGASGPTAIKQLAGILRLDHGTLTPLLRRMETAGLLHRSTDPADRRSSLLALTDRGDQVYAATEAVQCRIRADLGLSADELRALQLTLRRVTAAAEAAAAEDADALG